MASRKEEVVIQVSVQGQDASTQLKGLADTFGKLEAGAKKLGGADTGDVLKVGKIAAAGAAYLAVTNAVLDLAGAVGRALTGAFTSAVASSVELEASLARVVAVSGNISTNFELFESTVVEASLKSAFSAREAADALSFLAMAGFNAVQSTEALPDVLALAAAAGTDLATSADIASNVLSGFGAQASELGNINDILTATFTNTNTSLNQLGEALKFVAPNAKAANQSIADTVATIGLLGNAGIQGSLAGTSLRSALAQLNKPTKEAQAALDSLGVSVRDESGRIRRFADILMDLDVALGDAGDKAATVETIFGRVASSGINALLSQGPEAIKTLSQTAEELDGITKQIEKTQLDTVSGQFQIFTGSVETLGSAFGRALGPALKESLKSFNDIISATRPFSAETDKLAASIKALSDEFGDFALGTGIATVQIIEELIKSLQTAFRITNSVIQPVAQLAKQMGILADSGDDVVDTAQNVITVIRLLFNVIGIGLSTVFPPFIAVLGVVNVALSDAANGIEDAASRIRQARFDDALESIQVRSKQLVQDFKNLTTQVENFAEKSGALTFVRGIFGQLTEAEKEQQKQLEQGNSALLLRLQALKATDERLRIQLTLRSQLADIRSRGLKGLEREVAVAEAQARARDQLNRLNEQEARERKRRIEAQERETKKREEDIKKSLEWIETQRKADMIAEAQLKALRAVNDEQRVRLELQARLTEIGTKDLSEAQRELEITRAEIEAQKELADIERKRAEEQRKAQEERIKALEKEAQAIGNVRSNLSALSIESPRLSALATGFDAITASISSAQEAQFRFNNNIKGGTEAVQAAFGTTIEAAGAFTTAMGLSAQQQAGVLAAFEAAAAVASLAIQDYRGAAQHAVAAALYGAVAGGAGASSGAASRGGGGGSSALATSQAALSEDTQRRAAQINAEAIGEVLGTGQGAGTTVIIDARGSVLATDSPTFEREVTSMVRSGLRNEGVTLTNNTNRRRNRG